MAAASAAATKVSTRGVRVFIKKAGRLEKRGWTSRGSPSATVIRAPGREDLNGDGVIENGRAVLDLTRDRPGIAGSHFVIHSSDAQEDMAGNEIARLFLWMLMGGDHRVLRQLELHQLGPAAVDEGLAQDAWQGVNVTIRAGVADAGENGGSR